MAKKIVPGYDQFKLDEDGSISINAKVVDVTDPTAAQDAATKAYADLHILKSLFGAQSILAAVSDDTPVKVDIAEQRLVGRITDGNIAALTTAQVLILLGVEAGATADLTGLEIVTLLEALAAGNRLDHGAGLTGLGDDDHTQYTLHSLADAANDFLVASGANTFAKQTLAETLATLSPLTTRGDIMFRNATVSTRLAKGADNTILAMGANDPEWKTPATILSDIGAQPTDATLTSLALLGTAADKMAYMTNVDTWAETAITAAGRSMVGAANAAAQLLLMTTAVKAELDLLDLAALTAGELLVVTGAASAAWQSSGVKLTAPDISGTVSAASTLTLPAITLSGAVTGGSQPITSIGTISLIGTANLDCIADNAYIQIIGGADINSARLILYGKDNNGNFLFQTPNAAKVASSRLNISGVANTAVATWFNVTHTGLVLSGALNANSQDINNVAAPGAAGDPLIKGTRITTAELPAMTDEKIWKGTGANVEEIDVPVTATREFFVPVMDGDNGAGTTIMGYNGALVDGASDVCYTPILVPQDFTAITSIEVIFLPNETGASMHFQINTGYGAYNGGEAYNVHTETDAGRDIGATVTNQNLAHSISDLVDVAALAAGDLLLINVLYDATAIDSNASVRGIRLKYT